MKHQKEKINGKSKPLALTKSFAKKFRNLKTRYGRGNVRSGKCLSGEISSRGSVLRGSVRSGNCSVGEMSVGEVSVGELSSAKCQSGKCLVVKLSYNQFLMSQTKFFKNSYSANFIFDFQMCESNNQAFCLKILKFQRPYYLIYLNCYMQTGVNET